ncbi:hypothetical protein NEF87_004072 [Candidatus Lokiarchaeum ossiferum]|uniref:Uncharacterized protein n=1 Tax=Candidatus Lokiarchaeum ossiferum TaxID=2951803 RepID=A0ABY6HY45_9ARCH|nr:hypothetical protein NEF87_004072 [Candidatus Lokiarchaeum sp. B-35]
MNINFSLKKADHKRCVEFYQEYKMKNALSQATAIPAITTENTINNVFVFDGWIPDDIFRYLPDDTMYFDPIRLKKSIHDSIKFWWISFFLFCLFIWGLGLIVNPTRMYSMGKLNGLEVILLAGMFMGTLMTLMQTLPYRKVFRGIWINQTGECHYQEGEDPIGEIKIKMFSITPNLKKWQETTPFDAKKNRALKKTIIAKYIDALNQERERRLQNDPQFKEKVAAYKISSKKANKYGIFAAIFFGGWIICCIIVIIQVSDNPILSDNWFLLLFAPVILAMAFFLNFLRLKLTGLE